MKSGRGTAIAIETVLSDALRWGCEKIVVGDCAGMSSAVTNESMLPREAPRPCPARDAFRPGLDGLAALFGGDSAPVSGAEKLVCANGDEIAGSPSTPVAAAESSPSNAGGGGSSSSRDVAAACAIASAPYGTPKRPRLSRDEMKRICSGVGPSLGYRNSVRTSVWGRGAEMEFREMTDGDVRFAFEPERCTSEARVWLDGERGSLCVNAGMTELEPPEPLEPDGRWRV